LIFGRLGIVHGRSMRLYLATNRGAGVIPGTEVWLDGVRVGAVRWVRFQPPSADTTRRLVMALDVIEGARSHIRRNTRAVIEPGGSRLGAPVVQLSGADPLAPPIADGDTMVSTHSRQLREAREHIAAAAQSLPIVLDNFQAVREQVLSPSGTIGALSSEQGMRSLHVARSNARRFVRDTAYHNGTLALAFSAGFTDHVHAVLSRADSLVRRATAPTRPDGSTRRLARSLDDVDRQLSTLSASLAQMYGPTATDSMAATSLRDQIDQTRDRLHSLMADVAHRPFRYMSF
jgi:ABC-type transporter Mla subunit MlaD